MDIIAPRVACCQIVIIFHRIPVLKLTLRFAWILQRAVSSVHSAVAGGLMAARCIIAYINAKGFQVGGGGNRMSHSSRIITINP
jgi:hypothetical protein